MRNQPKPKQQPIDTAVFTAINGKSFAVYQRELAKGLKQLQNVLKQGGQHMAKGLPQSKKGF